MLKESATQKLIEYIQTLPKQERKVIAENILAPSKKNKPAAKDKKKHRVLADVKHGLLEVKEAKRKGKKLKTLDAFLNEI